ncbi:MAG: tol-pal system protein YbgF [Oceanicoccus sp.]|jgi:tol-pal system protein YbgF
MSIRLSIPAALLSTAAFVFSVTAIAQAPIIDASVNTGSGEPAQQAEEPAALAQNSSPQGEMFYQLQLLQQEVMQLRGIVEEQSYELKQMKEQNKERYIDLDRRVGAMTSSGPAQPNVRPTGSNNAVKQQAMVRVAPITGEKEAYDSAYSLVTNRRFDDGLEAFKQFLMDYPDGRYAPNSYYWMGELYQVTTPADLESARQSFTQLIDLYPAHPKVPDAMYKLGRVYFQKGDQQQSRDLLDKVVSNFSKGPNASTADKARQFIDDNF